MPKPIKKQTWSNIDVFGLINGLSIWDEQYKSLKYVRKPFDNGLDIKQKIFASHDSPPDITKQGLINGLSVEFGLQSYNVENVTVFNLTYSPVPSGDIEVQDIFAYYKQPGETTWTSLGQQVWPENYSTYKQAQAGFIVWQNDKYINISGYKNFRYSNIVEVLRDLADNTQLKFEYYVYTLDENNTRRLNKYTDIANPHDNNDTRFLYRKSISSPSLSGIVVYTLNDIPSNIKYNKYYDQYTNMAKEHLYNLRDYINSKFKHTWDKLIDRSSIWDVHMSYGSGHIPHFYDSIVPRNSDYCSGHYYPLTGGVEEMSYALYPETIIESGVTQNWYLKIYPGTFYIDGIPYYYFENYQKEDITFVNGEASIPNGLQRGMHTIMALSGYYDDYCNYPPDEYLSGVFEDYCYYTGPDGDSLWNNIYRRRPYLTAEMGHEVALDIGEYSIDWSSGVIHAFLPSGYENAVIIWDNVLVPSGTYLQYDLNPLNDKNLTFDKFFLYMSLDPNRR
jgi:hypothetical protein